MMGLKYHKMYVFITRLTTTPIFKGYFRKHFVKFYALKNDLPDRPF